MTTPPARDRGRAKTDIYSSQRYLPRRPPTVHSQISVPSSACSALMSSPLSPWSITVVARYAVPVTREVDREWLANLPAGAIKQTNGVNGEERAAP
jgi:hypothetical protein